MAVTTGLRRDAESAFAEVTGSRLAAGAAILLAVMPVAMALANRSAPLFLALAAILAGAAFAFRAGWEGSAAIVMASGRSAPSLAAVAFIALALASYGWSVDPAQTLRAVGEAAVPLLAGASLFVVFPSLAPGWSAKALAAGVIAAALICIVELKLGMPLRVALHLRAKAFEYNRPVLTLLAFFWPLLSVAVSRPRQVVLWVALVAATAAIWSSQSGTAMFAQSASCLAVIFAWRFPRAALVVAALAVTVVFAGVFAFGDLAWRLLPDGIYQTLAWTHAADRVEIWRSFGAAMLLHPWLGMGFGTTVTLGDSAIAGQIAEEFRRMLAVGHPHNGYLQIGVELGLAGCLIGLTIALHLLWSWRDLAGRRLCARLGLFTMAAATMLVGHGAWQAWWIAVLFAGATLARTLAPHHLGRADGISHS